MKFTKLKGTINYIYRFLKYILKKVYYSCKVIQDLKESKNIIRHVDNSKILFLSHNLGGGTLQYENNYLSDNKDICVAKIVSYKHDLCHFLRFSNNSDTFYIGEDKFYKLFEKKFDKIIVNSLIGYYEFDKIIDLLCEYKKKYPECIYIYNVHDFHCVCPNVNLFYNGWDCNLCCESNSCQFTKFTDRYDGNIKDWREKWNKLLMLMDEIVCFSENSASILNKAFNNKYSNSVVIRPHDMSYCKFSPIDRLDKLSLNIGIVGSVYTEKKGKNVIRLFSEKLNSNIPITIVGATSSQMGIHRKNVKCLGKYNHSDLQFIIEKEKITHIFFTSVWAETFSYLVSELMMMELPIVCFDFGAQADKVKSYSKGIVVKNIDEAIKVFEDLQ